MKKIFYNKNFSGFFSYGFIIFFLLTQSQMSVDASRKYTLKECLEIALKNNKDYSQVLLSEEESQLRMEQANALLYPSLGLNVYEAYISEVNKISLDQLNFQSPLPNTKKEISIGENNKSGMSVNLSEVIYSGGKLTNNLKTAKANREAAMYLSRISENQLRYDIIETFYQLAKYIRIKKVAEAGKKQIETHKQDIMNMYGQGILLKNEVLTVDIKLMEAELLIVQAINSIAKIQASLSEKMGLISGEKPDVSVNSNSCAPWPIPEEFLGKPSLRPEQHFARKNSEAAFFSAETVKASIKPQVGFSASYNYGWPGFTAGQAEWEPYWQAGINLTWNIFDGGMLKKQSKEYGIRHEKLLNALESTNNKVSLDILNASQSYEENNSKMLIIKNKAETARENMKIVHDNFLAGRLSNTTYLDSQFELTKAETDFAVISMDCIISWANYLRATGQIDKFNI